MSRKSKGESQNNFFHTCSQCRTNYTCCNDTTPPVIATRKKIIEAYLEAKKICVEKPFEEAYYVFPRLNENGYCIFHDKKTRKCIIHEVKPETCVAGPITFDINTKTGKIEWYIKMEKVCPLALFVYKNKKLLQKHLRIAKREIRRLVKELDSQALAAILKKEEPDTFKIGQDTVEKKIIDKLVSRRSKCF